MPEALFGLANALFWLGDLAGTIANCEKAYAGFRRRGNPMFAAGAALALVGYNKGYLGNTAAARGWLSRAARIIENEAPELRGELLEATAYVTEEPVESEALARQAAEIGRANGHSDLELMAMHAVGQALVQQGRTEEGMALLDEAMAGVIGGESGDPLTAAQMSCMTMVVCGSCIAWSVPPMGTVPQGFIERYGCPFLYAESHLLRPGPVENGDWVAAETLSSRRSRCRRASSRHRTRSRPARSPSSGSRREGSGTRPGCCAASRAHRGRRGGRIGTPSAGRAIGGRGCAPPPLAATSPNRLDVAAVIELLGEAEIALSDSGAAAERGRALIALGTASHCDLIVAHGERLLGHALAASDVPAACAHLETALAAFVHAGDPHRTAQTRLMLAQVLGHRDREVAGSEARTALAVFEDLGGQPRRGRRRRAHARPWHQGSKDRAEIHRTADQP